MDITDTKKTQVHFEGLLLLSSCDNWHSLIIKENYFTLKYSNINLGISSVCYMHIMLSSLLDLRVQNNHFVLDKIWWVLQVAIRDDPRNQRKMEKNIWQIHCWILRRLNHQDNNYQWSEKKDANKKKKTQNEKTWKKGGKSTSQK